MRGALIVAALVAGPAAAIPADRLASIIGDRVAGATIDYVEAADIDKVHIARGEGVGYEMKRGRVMYLNRPTSGFAFLRDGIVLAVDQATPHLCAAETVRITNPNSRLPIATLSLGQFIAYRRVMP